MLSNYKNIDIRIINNNVSIKLSKILGKEKSEYLKNFIPFNFNEENINKILLESKYDKYFGVFINDIIVGFYMLRGFDEGYTVPSYGVYISKEYSGLGLSKLTLQHAISICKLNSIKKLMLKVHPDNKIAISIYESFAFKKVSIDKKNKNTIYIKDLG